MTSIAEIKRIRDTGYSEFKDSVAIGVACHHIDELTRRLDLLRTASSDALTFLGYLIDNLPEDKVDNRKYLNLRDAIKESSR